MGESIHNNNKLVNQYQAGEILCKRLKKKKRKKENRNKKEVFLFKFDNTKPWEVSKRCLSVTAHRNGFHAEHFQVKEGRQVWGVLCCLCQS